MKVVIIGAGSYFFARPVICKFATSPVFNNSKLCLVDTDPEKLQVIHELACKTIEQSDNKVEVISSTDRRTVLEDAEVVVLTFSHDNVQNRRRDTEIALKHGIRMCSSDTIGPGGIFRALREIPTVMDIVKDIREYCPEAYLVNLVNPSAVIGLLLQRHASDIDNISLCDHHHEPYYSLRWLKRAKILHHDAYEVPESVKLDLDLAVAGVNHFTWMLRFNYKGRDMFPVLRNRLRKLCMKSPLTDPKARYNAEYTLKLFDHFGIYPDNMHHTKEYVPYFQGHGISDIDPEPIATFDADDREKKMLAWMEENKRYVSGELPLTEMLANTHPDPAMDIIENIFLDQETEFYINTFNSGAVSNMPSDAFLELLCTVNGYGDVAPKPVGEFPRGILSRQHQILDTHELTVEAAVTGNEDLIMRAMLTDPLCVNIEDALSCVKEFRRER